MNIEKLIPVVAAAGTTGLGVSLYLLSDYSVPLLNLLSDILESL